MDRGTPVDLLPALTVARDVIADTIEVRPRIALILGSGLGALADTLESATVISYDEIPHWPVSTVEGHAGRLVVGNLADVPVAVMQGRVHLYEGYAPWEVVFPTRVLALLGCESLVVTNAAGAIDPDFGAADLMLIRDHLNLQGSNPCTGPNLSSLGPRFFDMSRAYDPVYQDLARGCASDLGIVLREGVYAGLLGPSYETPAEIRMLRRLGADAVGMSTVPEVLAAAHTGMRVAGISCLTNMAAGVLDEPLDHEEVMVTAERVRDDLIALLRSLVEAIDGNGRNAQEDEHV